MCVGSARNSDVLSSPSQAMQVNRTWIDVLIPLLCGQAALPLHEPHPAQLMFPPRKYWMKILALFFSPVTEVSAFRH